MNTIENIDRAISQITDALEWIRSYKSEHYQQKFLQLVPLRCELRKMRNAQKENPAIAAYGESQKGKSYLMGNLLQKNGAPFKIRCNGKEYDFVADINPIGDKREATGVVTRFSSYIGHEELASDKYPARMKVMSPANIVTILVDGYFNDIIDDQRYSDSEIQERADELYKRYCNALPVQNNLTEDDVIDVKLYLQNFVNKAKISAFCENTDYFNKVALIIRNVPQESWDKVFSVLWHDNKELTELFNRLMRCLRRLEYSEVVYLPVDALLHHGDNKNTIMSVQCLNGLYNSPSSPSVGRSDVYVKDGGDFRILRDFDKSELSALCLEVSFKVDVDFLDDKAEFYYDEDNAGKPGFMSSDTYAKLTSGGKYISKKGLLEVSDLLDFPGAKNREQMKEATLDRYDDETQQTNLVKLFLRGKVSFLFNYFSDSKALNILMFCHNAEDVKVTQMYNVIDKWIMTYVGDTPQKRAKTMSLAGNIAPFFAIGTMFNIDMVKKNNQNANSEIALHSRWKGRFSQVMYQDCFHAGTDVDWFKNWSGPGVLFNNVYVLRDFKYSGCDGQGNNLYDGYSESDVNPRENQLVLPEDFYGNLMRSFVNDPENVGRFFDDPKVAWEATATMNNDGSLYIIKKLCVVASKMREVRESQFETRIQEIKSEILDKIRSYYQSENSNEKLEKHVAAAFDALNEFDVSISDNYFFGRLIDMLQITDDEAYDKVHEIIESPELIETVNTHGKEEIFNLRLPECHSVEEALKEYARVYHKPSPEAARQYLEDKGIDPKSLVSSSKKSRRTNSYVISDFVMKYWVEKLSSAAFLSRTVADSNFDMGVMSDLLENVLEMASTVNLTEYMSSSISDYVNVVAVNTANEFLVSDILRHCINSFVTDLGFSLLDAETRDSLIEMAKSKEMIVSTPNDHNEKSSYNEEELTQLFEDISNQAGAMAPSFSSHYNIWLDYMFLSYLATAGNITVIENPEANDKIGNIIALLNETL